MIERLFSDPGRQAIYRAMRSFGLFRALFAAKHLPAGIDPRIVALSARRALGDRAGDASR